MVLILQKHIPYNPFMTRKLPGIQPLAPQDWLQPDDAFAAQMRARRELLEHRRDQVLMLDDMAVPAAQELLQMVLEQLYPASGGQVQCADGQSMDLDWEDPLGTLGRITQQDFCILEKRGDQHVMTGAVLCFPASWLLSEKFLQSLMGIHQVVDEYDASLGARVQRLFDGVQTGAPLWRFNGLWYRDPALFQPRSIHGPRDEEHDAGANYFRSEKQTILRLPKTRAVVFAIHTYVLTRSDVLAQWRAPVDLVAFGRA